MDLEPVTQPPAISAPADVYAGGSVLKVAAAPGPVETADISVLTYNIKGLPWPIAFGRGKALREIGRELAQMRREGRQPDVVLLQEGFRGEVEDLVRVSGYRYWARGPDRLAAAVSGPRIAAPGRGAPKFTGSGLHILSDEPIVEVGSIAYRSCAGIDCMANKGAMLARIAAPGLPITLDIVNTHMNARHASRAPPAEARAAHNEQTRELIAFIEASRQAGAPLVVGGDFNVKKAPERYYFDALQRPYTVVSEYCAGSGSGCGPGAPDAVAEPWLRSQDLQGFAGGAVKVRPVGVETLFDAKGQRLSDHAGYLVRYRLSWSSATLAAAHVGPGIEVRPKLGKAVGFKVSWAH
jgi:endonuclease/exonuclease/phosphatase family metal-dependent hydrolase